MKFKVGDKVFTMKDGPLMVILSDKDKDNITRMDPTANKYACFSEDCDMSKDEMLTWMKEDI